VRYVALDLHNDGLSVTAVEKVI